jgi:hypothetical protein
MSLDFGNVSGVRLRHSLAHAADLHRRCVVNGETIKPVAKSLGLDPEQAVGAVRLLKAHWPVSPERLALIAMRDWGLEDADIGEMWGRSERWAQLVRENADEIRDAEPVPWQLEYLDAGLQPGDPDPSELWARAKEVRESGRFRGANDSPRGAAWSPPCVSWTRDYAFVSIGVA